jgi:hypothetical protein
MSLFDDGEHDDAKQSEGEYQGAQEADDLNDEGIRLRPALHQVAVSGFRFELRKKALCPAFNNVVVPLKCSWGRDRPLPAELCN